MTATLLLQRSPSSPPEGLLPVVVLPPGLVSTKNPAAGTRLMLSLAQVTLPAHQTRMLASTPCATSATGRHRPQDVAESIHGFADMTMHLSCYLCWHYSSGGACSRGIGPSQTLKGYTLQVGSLRKRKGPSQA